PRASARGKGQSAKRGTQTRRPPDFKTHKGASHSPRTPRGIPMRKKRQERPPRASHPAPATLRPRGWPRPRALGIAPSGAGSPPAPISELARHLAPRPRLRLSARPPI
uniref:Uncharacterized protein n=1 Tax=Aegilops tauschii subsp. strangulata TaxID=200361 RepID=A0A453F8I0_AEGTS